MKAICVDDEPILLRWLCKVVKDSADIEDAAGFDNAEEAIAYARNNEFDVAFLDVELGAVNGIALAQELRKIRPKCGVVFCTGHADYAVDAIYHLSVNGYLLKPVSSQDVQREIDRFKETGKSDAFVTVDFTHGKAVFDKNGAQIVFQRRLTADLLLYLVEADGNSRSGEEICRALWEGNEDPDLFRKNRDYLTHLFGDLKKTLDDAGVKDVILKTSDGYAVNMARINKRF